VSEFDGKVVLVTGCARARGMGRAISVAFARAGADVVATDVAVGGTRNENEEGLESLAGEIRGLGRRVLTLVGDVSRATDAERFVADALAQFGRIDVLVNNAAAPHGADRRLLWEVPEEAVNAICPGSVDTSRRESTARRERALAERDPNAPVLGLPPTGRIARPDDIARLALFFASEQSDHITGQAWNVDGGTVMH
jgi:NAD(P)-dependent dehydrogenase (short-subunit alcohol dehydrogenase family)